MKLEPFTYYRDAKAERAFLLADVVELPNAEQSHVMLIEWGKTRYEGMKYQLSQFLQLINDGALVSFTPKL